MPTKLTTDKYIKRAIEIYGDTYDYSETEYVNSGVKINVICPVHGVFTIRPAMHLRGRGCQACSYDRMGLITQDEFIKQCVGVHGDKYGYSLVRYVNKTVKVKIVCPKHGVFHQSPHSHLKGHGCIKCANTTRTSEDFYRESHLAHGDRYDYSLVDYVNMSTPVSIICSIHGVFKQYPHSHMKGRGCSKCAGNYPKRKMLNGTK